MDDLDLSLISDQTDLDTQSLFFATLLIYPKCENLNVVTNSLSKFVGDLRVAHHCDEALDILENEFLELVVLSLSQDDISSIHILDTIKRYRPGLPILVLANQHSLQEALIALREGAWDYVVEDDVLSLQHAMQSSIVRMAERKLSLLKDHSFKSERLAFWSAVQRAQDGLAIIGTNGRVSFANPCFMEFVKLLKSDSDNNESIDIVELISKCDSHAAEQLKNALFSDMSGTTMWSSELKVIPQSEAFGPIVRYFQIDMSSMSVFDSDSIRAENQRHVIWIKDITNIKEHEEFQREVISTTSHDLKGPLSTISSAAEMILDLSDGHSDGTKKLLNLIMSAASKSQSHIEEFLSAKRLEAGVITIEPSSYCVHTLLSEIVYEYEPSAASKKISLIYNPVNIEHVIYADKLALNRVLGNLLSNAIKFTQEEGFIWISMETHEDVTILHISDNGPGIDQNSLHNLFDKYSRVKDNQSVSGTGLGLYIVKSIMQAHKGKVEVQSVVSKGTTFSLFFPDKVKYC